MATRTISPAPQLLTIPEAAAALRLSTRTIRRRISAGDLPVVRTGPGATAIRVDRRALDDYLDRHSSKEASE